MFSNYSPIIHLMRFVWEQCTLYIGTIWTTLLNDRNLDRSGASCSSITFLYVDRNTTARLYGAYLLQDWASCAQAPLLWRDLTIPKPSWLMSKAGKRQFRLDQLGICYTCSGSATALAHADIVYAVHICCTDQEHCF